MTSRKETPGCARRALLAGLSFALAATVAVGGAQAAYATNATDSLGSAVATSTVGSSILDLRTLGLVTPVKNQAPWKSCWAFAAVSASETSILSAAREQGIDLSTIDLSELQIAALAYSYTGVPESVSGAAQAGEGYYSTSKNPNRGLDEGGNLKMVASAYAAGIGPVAESDAPYKNAEDIITWTISGENLIDGVEGHIEFNIDNPTEEQLEEYRAKGATCTKACYAGTYHTKGSATEDSKEAFSDWSVDQSLWQKSLYEFSDSNLLPETRIMEDGVYQGTNMESVAAIKAELDAGHAVGVSFHTDLTVPGATLTPGQVSYLNEKTWAHYTYNSNEAINHGVTIVGYDDTYSRTNFSDGVNNLPEGDGAWIVKNNFGSQAEDFPNGQVLTPEWGLTDENGNHTGYFYLSYYDKSVTSFETFEFDLSISNVGADTGRIIDQYDYLPVNNASYGTFSSQASAANIFTAKSDMAVRALWCETTLPNTTVTYDVYLLDSDAADPTDAEHSRKVFSATDTYAYAGYHRYKIDDASWIAMRSGQRYSVVVTQEHQAEDGSWTYIVPINYNVAVEDKNESTVDEQGNVVVSEEWKAGFVAKVNAGESWVTSKVEDWTSEEGGTSGTDYWTDWSLVTAAVTEKNPSVVYDNQPIKAYAQAQSWASVEELASLEEAVKAAEAALAAAQISADGSDVAAGTQWMTQAEHDALASAVAEARAQLALAGDYRNEVELSTPSSDTVKAAVESVGFEAKTGSKAADAQPAGESKQGGESKQARSHTPSTGDVTAAASVPALLGTALLAARRRFKR